VGGARIGVGNDLSSLLTSFDSLGRPQWQRDWQLQTAGTAWGVSSGSLRLTNDGGALTFAHVSSADLSRSGLWISKVPARSGVAAFDPSLVTVAPDGLPPVEGCTMQLVDDGIVPTALAMQDDGFESRFRVEAAALEVESLLAP